MSLRQNLFDELKKHTTYISSFTRTIIRVTCIVLTLVLQSCFTGVEGTKTITLSRDDRKMLKSAPEEEFFGSVEGEPLEKWAKGHPFVASDDRALLIFEQRGLDTDFSAASLGGKIIVYEGTEISIGEDGREICLLLFKTPDGKILKYNTGLTTSEAQREVTSDKIPMLIDYNMVMLAKSLLKDRMVWIKSPLWYDENGNRIEGRKFVEVKIEDIRPGTVAFPMMVKFCDESGAESWAYMNFGHSAKDSRSFANLFSLTDMRKSYPSVTDENWAFICRSRVANGMTKEECRLSLGNPADVDAGRSYSHTIDVWKYPDGAVLWFEDGILTKFRI